MRDDKLIDWYLRGLGGCINALDYLVDDGVTVSPTNEQSLQYLTKRLENLYSVVKGYERPNKTGPNPWQRCKWDIV